MSTDLRISSLTRVFPFSVVSCRCHALLGCMQVYSYLHVVQTLIPEAENSLVGFAVDFSLVGLQVVLFGATDDCFGEGFAGDPAGVRDFSSCGSSCSFSCRYVACWSIHNSKFRWEFISCVSCSDCLHEHTEATKRAVGITASSRALRK